jgi:hypothetical protein
VNDDLTPLSPPALPAREPLDPPSPPVEVVELIALAVRACPAVAELHPGQFGQTTTYLPGRRVAGVTTSPEEIVVGVVGRYPTSVAVMAAEIRAAVNLVAPGVPVSVIIEDLAEPQDLLAEMAEEPDAAEPETDIGEPVAVWTEPVVPVAGAGPVLPTPTPGVRPGDTGPISARPPLATPLAPPEKERPS